MLHGKPTVGLNWTDQTVKERAVLEKRTFHRRQTHIHTHTYTKRKKMFRARKYKARERIKVNKKMKGRWDI